MRNGLYLAFLGLILTAASAAAGPMDAKTVVVSGYAEQTVKPDFATVEIGVVSVDTSTARALDANTVLMRKVLDAIKAEGIADTAVRTNSFGIRAIHPPRKDQSFIEDEMVTSGYRVMNFVTVTITNLKKVGAVIDAATRAGANVSGDVEFDVQNRQALEARLLADAVRDARRNAEIMAAAESAKIGKLIAVSNTAPVEPRWGTRTNFGTVTVTAQRQATNVIMEGVVRVTTQVMAIYALE